jgi:hypothetical protein
MFARVKRTSIFCPVGAKILDNCNETFDVNIKVLQAAVAFWELYYKTFTAVFITSTL